jgi:hypothetical protein
MEVVDVQGKRIFIEEYQGGGQEIFQQTLSLQSFANGQYWILLRQKGIPIFQGTLIKQN